VGGDNTTRFKKDERRGLQARVPNVIAEGLPDEGEFEWSVTEDGALLATLTEISRKPIKIKQRRSTRAQRRRRLKLGSAGSRA
jgi:hypothetical protein